MKPTGVGYSKDLSQGFKDIDPWWKPVWFIFQLRDVPFDVEPRSEFSKELNKAKLSFVEEFLSINKKINE